MPLHAPLYSLLIVLVLAIGSSYSNTAARSNHFDGLAIASVETEPVPRSGDAADDPAIWINPADPSQSTIIATDKKGGLIVYDLAGKQLQYLADGTPNNVDIRAGFQLGGQAVALVTTGKDNNDTLGIYRVDPATRLLENVAARVIATGATYGSCMYHSAKTKAFYYFVTGKNGVVEQWELFATSSNQVDATMIRSFKVGTQIEGCVADDQLGHLYISEESVGIWKYAAEPDGGDSAVLVDTTGPEGHLTADVEGLAIAYNRDGTGYLLASSQGESAYTIYQRAGNNAYLRTFKIVAGNGIDGTEQTDGIDVTTANLGPAFPNGVFIAQDGKNDTANQNFKLVPWQQIADIAMTPAQSTRIFLSLVRK
jgi:3-phytase